MRGHLREGGGHVVEQARRLADGPAVAAVVDEEDGQPVGPQLPGQRRDVGAVEAR